MFCSPPQMGSDLRRKKKNNIKSFKKNLFFFFFSSVVFPEILLGIECAEQRAITE